MELRRKGKERRGLISVGKGIKVTLLVLGRDGDREDEGTENGT